MGGSQMSMENYLDIARKEAFKGQDVMVIDHGMKIKEMFEQAATLPCEEQPRLNNSLKAPLLPQNRIPKKAAPKAPVN